MNSKKLRLAYMAGVLDGDGSFSLLKGTSHTSVSPLYYPMIQLANSEKILIDLFHKELGGSSFKREAHRAKDGFMRKTSYQWKLEKSPKCLPFLEDIITYLVVKKERAVYLRDYIVDNPFIRGSNALDNSILMRREKAYLKMKWFNDNPDIHGELFSKAKRNDSEDNIFWSYVAGLMDTDGSFTFKKENRTSGGSKSPVYCPVISLSMVDCRAIYYLMNNFIGGNMMAVKAKTATNGFCYRFSITSRKAAAKFLKKVIPFLFIKKHIAQALLEACEAFCQMHGKGGVSKDELEIREYHYTTIQKLNYGVSKSSLMDLKPLPGNAEGNKGQE